MSEPKPRRFAAPIIGFFIAGAGHVTVGRYRRALAWFSADLAASVAAIFALTRASPKLLLLYGVVALLLRIASIVDVAFLRAADPAQLPRWGITILLWVALYGTSALAGLTVRVCVVEAFKIPAGSMSPTLLVGDHIFVDKRARTPERGAVMVFRYPKDPDKDFVKRVIAIGGDTVEMRDGTILVNGQPVPRHPTGGDCRYPDWDEIEARFIERICEAWEETVDGHSYSIIFERSAYPSRNWPPVTVPPHQFYVLGDNRDNSHDSRYWGFVPDENVKGRAISIWFSTQGGKIRWDRIGQPIR